MNDTTIKKKLAKLTKKQRDEWQNALFTGYWNENMKVAETVKASLLSCQLLSLRLQELADMRLLMMIDDYYISCEHRAPLIEEVENMADTVKKRYIPDNIAWRWRLRLYKSLIKRGMQPEDIALYIPLELVLKEADAPRVVRLELMPETASRWERYAKASNMTLEEYLENGLAGLYGVNLVEEG